MTNAFGVVLDSASVRRAAVEGVPETVIAAIYLLHERSIDEIASKLRPEELGHVIRLVGRCPSCYPPGTLEALKSRRPAPSPEPSAASTATNVAAARPAARIKPSAEHIRQAKERRLANLGGAAPPMRKRAHREGKRRRRTPETIGHLWTPGVPQLAGLHRRGGAVLGVVGALITLALSDGCCGRVNQAFA